MRDWHLPLLVATVIFGVTAAASAAENEIERGKYLVTISGCGACHTPCGLFPGKPYSTRNSRAPRSGLGIPGVGVFLGGNLTPDKETGLGDWTIEQIIAAITKGETPNGRNVFGHALAGPRPSQVEGRRRGDRRLSEEPSAGQERSSGTVRAPRTFRRRLSRSSFRATSTPRCPRRSKPAAVLQTPRRRAATWPSSSATTLARVVNSEQLSSGAFHLASVLALSRGRLWLRGFLWRRPTEPLHESSCDAEQ